MHVAGEVPHAVEPEEGWEGLVGKINVRKQSVGVRAGCISNMLGMWDLGCAARGCYDEREHTFFFARSPDAPSTDKGHGIR